MRIFNVTLTREMQCTIAAENEAELIKALKDARYDFDDWDPPEWDWSIHDPLTQIRSTKDLPRMKMEPQEPDMGVDDRGEIKAIEDLPETLMDEVRATLLDHQRKIVQEELQVKLPGM